MVRQLLTLGFFRMFSMAVIHVLGVLRDRSALPETTAEHSCYIPQDTNAVFRRRSAPRRSTSRRPAANVSRRWIQSP